MESLDRKIDLVSSQAARGDFRAAQAELEKLKKGNDTSSAYAGELCYLEGLILYKQDRYKEAQEKAEQAYELLRRTLKNRRIGQVHLLIGYIFVDVGDLKRAQIQIQDAVSSFRRAGDEKGMRIIGGCHLYRPIGAASPTG